jgi:hypothetical protein
MWVLGMSPAKQRNSDMQSYIAQINGVDTVRVNVCKGGKVTFKSLQKARFEYVPASDRPTLRTAALWLAGQRCPMAISGLPGGWTCLYPKGRSDLI